VKFQIAAIATLALTAACGGSEAPAADAPAAEAAAPAAAAPAPADGLDAASQGDPRRADPAVAPPAEHAHGGEDADHDHGPGADHTH
jgi:hypothetical protein